MKLSIIIPAYNEGVNIRTTVRDVVATMDRHLDEDEYEVIVVDDGSRDNTAAQARRIKNARVKIFTLKHNHGKGGALTYGVRHAKGELVTFLDAGGDFHPKQIVRLTKLMEALDADIVIGSKRHPMSRVNYPNVRRFYSWVYQMIIRVLFRLKVRDTQTGLKVFKRHVLAKVLPRVLVKRYAFDLELLVVANALGFRKISEGPIDMRYNFQTTGINRKEIRHILVDTAAIFYRTHILRYYTSRASGARSKPLNKKR